MVKKRHLKKKRRIVPSRAVKAGLPPGTAVYTGDRQGQPTLITLIDYDEHHFLEKVIPKVQDAFGIQSTQTVSWLNVEEISDVGAVEALGCEFEIHPLVVEDILHTAQRPKADIYDSYLYIVLRMLQYDPLHHEIISEQVSFILGNHCLLTFQEKPGDVFEQIRQRIRTGMGRLRKMGPDYLAYALMDAIVDSYFTILEAMGEQIEDLEEELLNRPDPDVLGRIHKLRNELRDLRRSVWPMRELIGKLERSESPLIGSTTRVYLRDLYDHSIQVAETIDSFRDIVAGMLDLYLSSLSNRTNETMKVLTMMASIFIPLSFVTGVFGMNFDHMPELRQSWAYPAGFWVLIVLMISGMLIYFKKKRWL